MVPWSLRLAADGGGIDVLSQRFVRAAVTLDDVLARGVGQRAVVTTSTGEVRGVLRAVDRHALAIDVDGALVVVRRDDQAQAVRIDGAAVGATTATAFATVKAQAPGRHTLTASYLVDDLRGRRRTPRSSTTTAASSSAPRR
ncbi:MAG: hypothetical protein R2939_07200 [Kofleriaceae bacterium]